MSDRRLTPDLLLAAYASGIFPMADARDDPVVYWVEPRRRGVIPLDRFHVSRSLKRRIGKDDYRFHLNAGFEEVIDACADRSETWINATIRDLMLTLHENGHAHSFEVRDPKGHLMGGMYGLTIGSAFFGESMVSPARDGSKLTLTWAVDHLRRAGFTLFDTQFITDHLRTLGAIEIPKSAYMTHLKTAIETSTDIHAVDIETSSQAMVQRMTQMS